MMGWWRRRQWERLADTELTELARHLSQRQIAERFGIARSVVQRRLTAARRQDQGLTVAEAARDGRKPEEPPRRLPRPLAPQAEQEELTFKLLEPEGDHLSELWEHVKRIEMPPGEEEEAYQAWLFRLSQPNALWYDVLQRETLIGYASLQQIALDHGAVAHVTFFDQRTRGREASTMRFLAALATDLGLQVVWAYTPETNAATLPFLRRSGWEYCGTLPDLFRIRTGNFVGAAVHAIRTNRLRELFGAGGDRSGSTDAPGVVERAKLARDSDPDAIPSWDTGLRWPDPLRGWMAL